MCSSVIKRFLQENIHPTCTRTQIRLRVATSLIFASEEVAEAGQAEGRRNDFIASPRYVRHGCLCIPDERTQVSRVADKGGEEDATLPTLS